MHLPEAGLQRGRLRGGGRRERVRVDLGEREVPEGEAHRAAQLPLDALDLAVRHPRIRALVVAVLEDHAAVGGATDVVDAIFEQHGTDHPLPPPCGL